jgi:toxin ParE1/3/4
MSRAFMLPFDDGLEGIPMTSPHGPPGRRGIHHPHARAAHPRGPTRPGPAGLYLSQLEAFHLLAQEPGRGRPCDEIRQGYRKYYVGRHVIFYRQAGPDIEIIRILHERIDIDSDYPSESLLQQDIDDELASGLSDRSMDELIAEAEREAVADVSTGDA